VPAATAASRTACCSTRRGSGGTRRCREEPTRPDQPSGSDRRCCLARGEAPWRAPRLRRGGPRAAAPRSAADAEVVRRSETIETPPSRDGRRAGPLLAGSLETLRTQDARRLDAVAAYANGSECRAVTLRRYFGEDEGAPCRLCDMCRGGRERAESFWEPLEAPPPPARRRPGRRRRGRSRRRGAARPARG
jgi:hypothetical protein